MVDNPIYSYRSNIKPGAAGNLFKKNRPLTGVFARELKDMPDLTTFAARKTDERLGPFKYEDEEYITTEDLMLKGPFEMENGAIYLGQWSKEGKREGRGT